MANLLKIIIPVFFFLFLVAAILMFISGKKDGPELANAQSTETIEQVENPLSEVDGNLVAELTTSEEVAPALPKRNKFTLPKRRTKDDSTDIETDQRDVDETAYASNETQVSDADFVDEENVDQIDDLDLSNDREASMATDSDLVDVFDADAGESLSTEELDESISDELVENDRADEVFDTAFQDESGPWADEVPHSEVVVEPRSVDLPRPEVARTERVRDAAQPERELRLDRETRLDQETAQQPQGRFDLQGTRETSDEISEPAPWATTTRTDRLVERKTEPKRRSEPTPTTVPKFDSRTMSVSARDSDSTKGRTELSIRNATKLPVAFLLNGKVRRLAPGRSFEQRWNGGKNEVKFDRGGSYGSRVQELQPRRYEFRVNRNGWDLTPSNKTVN